MRFQLKDVYLSLSGQARRNKKALQQIGLVIGGLAVGLFVSLLGVGQAVSQVKAIVQAALKELAIAPYCAIVDQTNGVMPSPPRV